MSTLYKVGIYCRLSVDDTSNSAKAKNYIPADESTSIENQRELLSKFVMLNGWVETKTYVDDGYSGGNFQRPGFLEMLEDARNGVINLILVKDLSRLGRDFVEVGRYTDTVFPSLGCRFVSVLDSLDSEGDNTDMLHFRSLMNDYHLRDLSEKTKSVLRSKKASGQYLAAYAPYGYRKSAENKHKLLIDEYAAGIVRRIYGMRLAGTAYSKIAATLNQEGIVSPRRYWYLSNGRDARKVKQLWTDTMVKIILNNETYMGTILTNRSGTRSYKDSTPIAKPKNEWIRCVGTHDAIIPVEDWNAVQAINAAGSFHAYANCGASEKLFAGKLVCADCKAALNRITKTQHWKNGESRRYVDYLCGQFVRSGKSVCSAHRISELSLKQIIQTEIRAQAQAVALDEGAVVERLKSNIDGVNGQRLSITRQEITRLRRRVQELETLTAKLYEDKYNGAISENTFVMLMQKNEQERLIKAEHLETLSSEVDEAEKKIAAIQSWAAIIRKYLNLQELDRAVVEELIDHIEVGERTVVDGQRHQDIKVFYRFVGLVV